MRINNFLMVVFVLLATRGPDVSEACEKFNPKVCDFSTDSLREPSCPHVNGQESLSGLIGSKKCRDLMKEDGDDCIFAYYKLSCSHLCRSCKTDAVCSGVCENLKDDCKKSHASECFNTGILNACKGNQDGCSDLDINEGAVKTRSDSGSSGSSAPSNKGSSDSDSDDSSNSATVLSSYLFLATLILVL